MSKLAKLLHCGMMSAAHHCKLEGGPKILTSTIRDIATTSYPQWIESREALLHFAKEYLSKQDFVTFKCWDEGMQTAETLMQLDGICHFIIEQLS